MRVVLVESPAKVKSIAKYLGKGYHVLSTYGHIRDLPSKTGSVNPAEDFSMTWQTLERSEKALKEIVSAVKPADTVILATDPDREGEAISWHVIEYLKENNLLKDKKIERVTFNAITKNAVLEAIQSPRTLNQELVEAYLARLSLDYLVGFTLSPILWRKLPGSRSAGRVQSVALRLVVEREKEIETFQSQEYWTVEGLFQDKTDGPMFKGRLIVLEKAKLEKFSLTTEQAAGSAVALALTQTYHVADLEKKRTKRMPQPPFTTSTLLQEASRKLGFSPSRTSQIAQKLYEGIEIDGETTGLITYIRTDSVTVAPEGITDCRAYIQAQFAPDYLPDTPRVYKTKAKNAQEAHEAIRPTDLKRKPGDLTNVLDGPALQLYELIWKRMLASQMAPAQFDQTSVDIANTSGDLIFRANGSVLVFDGFLKLYQEGRDEGDEDEDLRQLPPLTVGQSVLCGQIDPFQHFTQPAPRYSEASLIKKMEELGIGRPSTYPRIMQVLRDRNYVRLEKKTLLPEERGRLVTAFLTHFFERYVAYDFTAQLENQLDEISAGSLPWKEVLRQFWVAFHATIKDSEKLKISDVLETLETDLARHLFPSGERTCPDCKEGQLGLRLGKFGAFLGCSNYPTCAYTRPLHGTTDDADAPTGDSPFPKTLGTDPKTDLAVSLRLGPYGIYLQWGEGAKPKRVSLPKGFDNEALSLEQALVFGALPRALGQHPETGDPLVAGLGRFGPYIKQGDKFVSFKDMDLILNGTLEDAVEALAQKALQPARPARGKVAAAKKKPAPKVTKKTTSKRKDTPSQTKRTKE